MATELDLLQDILDELRRANNAGGGSAASGTGVSAAAAAARFNPFIGALNLAKGTISVLSDVAGKAADSVFSLAETAANGSASLSAMTGFITNTIPGMQMFGRVLNLASVIAEQNIATQQSLGASGATFAGSLTAMRDASARTYLSLDQLAGVVRNNSDIFASMGGNVQSGVAQFANIQKSLLAPGTATAGMLAGMGISAQEAADLTASYMRSQGSMNKAQLRDQQTVAAAVTQYASELTMLSQITGQNREEIKKRMDAEMQESQFEAYLASLAPAEADKLRQGLQNAMAQGGQGAVDALKAMAMGFPPMTEAGRLYAATQQAGMKTLEDYNDRAKNAGISIDENARLNRQSLAQAIAQGAGDMEQMRTVLQASGLSGAGLAKTLAEAQKLQNKFMQDGKMMSETEIAAKLEAMDKENKIKDSEAKTVQDMQRRFQELSNSVLSKLMPALDFFLNVVSKLSVALGPAFENISKMFSDVITRVDGPIKSFADLLTDYVAPQISRLISWFSDTLRDLGLSKSSEEFFGTLKSRAQEAFNYLVDNVFKPLWNTIKPVLIEMFKDVAKSIGSAMLDAINPFKKSSASIESPEVSYTAVPMAATGGIFSGPSSGYPIIAHGTEAIVPIKQGSGADAAQLVAQTMGSTANENLASQLQTLNTISMEMLRYMKDTAEQARRNVEATKNLSGNLYPSI